MSSSGGDGGGSGGGGTSENPLQYFCHQCNRNVLIIPSSSELICPNCNDGFLEEPESPIPNPNPNPNPSHPFVSFHSELGGLTGTLPFLFSGPGGDDLSSLFGGGAPNAAEAFNPLVFIQNYVQTLRAGGHNVQFVVENSGDPTAAGAFRFPGNLTSGDYFFGPGLEELIQQLAENDPNRYGTPPASKSSVEGLPDVSVTEELLASDSSQCAVCKDTFMLGEAAKQMPCKHIYHSDCILPWLEMHNSCPVCRYELPTDDPDYERRARGGGPPAPVMLNRFAGPGGLPVEASSGSGGSGIMNQFAGPGGSAAESSGGIFGGGSGGGGGGGADGNSTRQGVQRGTFRVSLPWPFRQLGGPAAETSNIGNNANSNSDDNNSGQSNSQSRGNQNFQSETRQEDLD